MPKRDKLFELLASENALGVLLMVQMDGIPETLQLMITATEVDETTGSLHDKGTFVVRALGVVEHQVSIGLFNQMRIVDGEHPLLQQHNTATAALFFRGKIKDPNEALVDVLQAYASTFGPWRHMPLYMNPDKPLLSVLSSEGDLVGSMPKPLADNIGTALEKHGVETKQFAEPFEEVDEHGLSRLRQALIIDESYIVALSFTVDELGKV